MSNTHFAVIYFSGDPGAEHPDPELNGKSPGLTLLAAGSEQSCWDAAREWTQVHPLRLWETVEILARDPAMVADREASARRPD